MVTVGPAPVRSVYTEQPAKLAAHVGAASVVVVVVMPGRVVPGAPVDDVEEPVAVVVVVVVETQRVRPSCRHWRSVSRLQRRRFAPPEMQESIALLHERLHCLRSDCAGAGAGAITARTSSATRHTRVIQNA